jgi:FKBP-type peptidyl-prolyl cis-trans isomerase 2
MFIGPNQVVSFHFSMYDNSGNLLQQTFSGKPNRYLHGGSTIDLRLQHLMEGLAPGEEKELTLDDKTGTYKFLVTIDSIRPATKTEMMLGYPVEAGEENCGDDCDCYIAIK